MNNLITKEAEILTEETNNVVLRYAEFKISNNDDYIETTDILKQIKSKSVEIENLRKTMTKPLDDSKKAIMDFFKPIQEKLSVVESRIKLEISVFQKEQERIRRQEQEKLELKRQEELRKQEEKLKKAQEEGDIKKVEKIQEKIEVKQNTEIIVESKIPEVKGLSTRKIWKYKLIDINKLPREYMIENDEMLKKIAVATKGTLKIDGIEFYFEEVLSSGR